MTPILGLDPAEPASGAPVEATDAIASPTLVPRIYWSGVDRISSPGRGEWSAVDLHAFPARGSIEKRFDEADGSFHLPAFNRHVRGALRSVLVADRYLLCGGEAAERELLSWFPPSFEASEVRIAFGGYAGDDRRKGFRRRLQSAQDLINRRRADAGIGQVELRIKENMDSRSFPHLHDRFAVVDRELWHFGATVGGTHCGVTAASRGWSVESTDARRFFNELWRQSVNPRTFRPACGGAKW